MNLETSAAIDFVSKALTVIVPAEQVHRESFNACLIRLVFAIRLSW